MSRSCRNCTRRSIRTSSSAWKKSGVRTSTLPARDERFKVRGWLMREVLAEVTTALAADRPGVWCAVVETRGSTPQKAGAAMLVFADGGQVGTLGGGCVEAEVRRRALHLLQGDNTRPEVLTFNLDDNYGWD